MSVAVDLRPDLEQIKTFWQTLVKPGDLHEIRITDSKKEGRRKFFGTVSGYFNDVNAVVRELSSVTGRDAEAVYVTLNPVNPDLRARADNRLADKAKSGSSDNNVERLRWMLFDPDPDRLSSISATDAERDAALAVRDELKDYLTEMGWPEPGIVTMSGNGGGLLYRIDLENTTENSQIIESCLKALDSTFTTKTVKLDTSVFNPSRLTKHGGTVAAKGDDVPDLGRRWRVATAECNPSAGVVSIDQLKALAAQVGTADQPEQPKPKGGNRGIFDGDVTVAGERSWTVGEVLKANTIGYTIRTKGELTVYDLERCIVPGTNHSDGAAIIETSSGKLAYRCHHNVCRDKRWADVRGALGREYRNGTSGGSTTHRAGAIGDEVNEHDAVPDFPTALLPPAFRALTEAGARSIVCPAELLGVPLLVLAGGAIGRVRELELKPTWRESGNLYATSVVEPGGKKTPATQIAAQAIHVIQAENIAKFETEMAQYEMDVQSWEESPKGQRGEKPTEPICRHNLSTDATTEALGPMMLRSKGLVLLQDELTAWVGAMNQYRGGKGADRQRFLSCWSRAPIKIDRKGSKVPLYVPNPFLSVYGGIQDDLLSDLGDPAERKDGFLDRILMSYPVPVKDRWTDEGIDYETMQAVEEVFRRLDALRGRDSLMDQGGPVVIRFGPDSAKLWAAWHADHTAEMADGNFKHRLRGPWAKMPSQLARIALILHCLDDPHALTLRADTLAAAADLIDYFKAHAAKVYRHLGSQKRSLTLKLLQAMKERGEMAQSKITTEIFRNNITAEQLRGALEELEESGLVTRRTAEQTNGTGRRAVLWAAV